MVKFAEDATDAWKGRVCMQRGGPKAGEVTLSTRKTGVLVSDFKENSNKSLPLYTGDDCVEDFKFLGIHVCNNFPWSVSNGPRMVALSENSRWKKRV